MVEFGVSRKYGKDLPKYICELSEANVNAYEMGIAYGFPTDLSDDIVSLAEESGVGLSCHLPFWINLGNSNEEKNIEYLVSGLQLAEKLRSVATFHLGYYGNADFRKIRANIVKTIRRALDVSRVSSGKLGIETTGKQKAIGTIDETIELITSIEDSRVIPVIDWAHIYARNNGTYPISRDDFEEVLVKFEEDIGHRPCYFHGGGIEYKAGNEIRHASARIHHPPLPHLFSAFRDLGYEDFIFIVESPDSFRDVEWLRKVWESPEDYWKEIPQRKPVTLMDF